MKTPPLDDSMEYELLSKYFEHMHSTVMELYVSIKPNPLELLVDKDKLERKGLPLDPENITSFLIYMQKTLKLADEVAGIVSDATDFLLHKRVVDTIEDYEIRGAIDWGGTLLNLGTGYPPVQKVVSHTLNSPENLLLKAVVEYLLERLEHLINRLEKMIEAWGSTVPGVEKWLSGLSYLENELRGRYRKLSSVVEESFLSYLPVQMYREDPISYAWRLLDEIGHAAWRPEWVERLVEVAGRLLLDEDAERGMDKLVDLIVNTLVKKEKLLEAKYFFKVMAWRLYEVYVLYLVLKALGSVNARISLLKPRVLSASIGGRVLSIYYNVPFPSRSLKPLKPIPDISILDDIRVVMEVKFSRSPSYLAQGIFKLISYIALLDADAGILVYPSTRLRKPLERDLATVYRSILKKIESGESGNPYKFTINIGGKKRAIYVAKIEPLSEKISLNQGIIESITREILESRQSRTIMEYTPVATKSKK